MNPKTQEQLIDGHLLKDYKGPKTFWGETGLFAQLSGWFRDGIGRDSYGPSCVGFRSEASPAGQDPSGWVVRGSAGEHPGFWAAGLRQDPPAVCDLP
jgi:hypothetical protein